MGGLIPYKGTRFSFASSPVTDGFWYINGIVDFSNLSQIDIALEEQNKLKPSPGTTRETTPKGEQIVCKVQSFNSKIVCFSRCKENGSTYFLSGVFFEVFLFQFAINCQSVVSNFVYFFLLNKNLRMFVHCRNYPP